MVVMIKRNDFRTTKFHILSEKITYIIMEYYTTPLKVKVMFKGISKFDRLVSKKFPPFFFFTF